MAEPIPRRLSGWGRTQSVRAEVVAPTTAAEVASWLSDPKIHGGVIARGLGRSYGDPAQVAGGLVLDLVHLNHLGPIGEGGSITVGGGASLDALISSVLPKGYFTPVSPGTRQVSIGGAIAADIHGKNHHREGSFCSHVTSMTLATPTGIMTVSPTSNPELFWATAGGMGLTGVVLEATISLLEVPSGLVTVDTDRFEDLDALMAEMVGGDDRYRYSVAWVDCMAPGARLGRSVLTRGDHAPSGLTDGSVGPLPKPAKLAVPFQAPSGLLNRASITAFNEAFYRRAPKHKVGELQRLSSFFHPLDGVANWNLLYGNRGFLQYQFVVPDHAAETVRLVIDHLSGAKIPGFLAVLKRFGPGDPGPLSFPMAGWTLAIDVPIGPPSLPRLLDRLDDLVAEAGGRIYLAKDARLRPELVEVMYPELDRFRKVKAEVDPNGVLTSDLARRLNLVEGTR